MANRPKGYGMSRDCADKLDAKYSPDDEEKIVLWITTVANVQGPNGTGRDAFQEWLQDGLVLHAVVEALGDNSIRYKVKDPSKSKLTASFVKDDNIAKFLGAITTYGVNKMDLFQTVSLKEGTNLAQVQTCLHKLASVAGTKNASFPKFGVKISKENKREFDEQKLKEGRNVASLQMGTNQVASQQGMTAYGLGRQIAPPK